MTNSDHNASLYRPNKERITNEEIDDLANKLLDCSREGIYAFARAAIAADRACRTTPEATDD